MKQRTVKDANERARQGRERAGERGATHAALTGARTGTQFQERRQAARRAPGAGEPIVDVRMRGGRELVVVDVSDSGIMVQGSERLLPGTNVEVHVMTTAGRVLVRTRVVRSFVYTLTEDSIRYRGALTFDRLVDTAPAVTPAT